jgi:hypothetical protein
MKIGNIFLKTRNWIMILRGLGMRWIIIIGIIAAIYCFFTL